jgi:hypothetical protein
VDAAQDIGGTIRQIYFQGALYANMPVLTRISEFAFPFSCARVFAPHKSVDRQRMANSVRGFFITGNAQ